MRIRLSRGASQTRTARTAARSSGSSARLTEGRRPLRASPGSTSGRSGGGRRLLVLLLLATMSLATAFGERGLLRLPGLTRDLDTLTAATARLADENRRLAAEITRLRDDPRALEAAARRELGLVAPDEIVFEFQE